MKKSLVFVVAILVFLVHLGSAIRVGFEVSSDWDVSVSSIQTSPNFFHVRNKSNSLVLTYTDEHVTEPSKAKLGMCPVALLPAYNSSAKTPVGCSITVNLHTQGSNSRHALIRFRLTKPEAISSKQHKLPNQSLWSYGILIILILLAMAFKYMLHAALFYNEIQFGDHFQTEDYLNHEE